MSVMPRSALSAPRRYGVRNIAILLTVVVVVVTLGATAASAAVTFVGGSTTATTGSSVRADVPVTVAAGDTLLLFASANRADTVIGTPAGWQRVGEQQDESLLTVVFSATATTNQPRPVVTSSIRAKLDLQLLAYRGTGGVSSIATAAETITRATHTTPTIGSVDTDSRTVSFWADKSSSTTSWTTGSGLERRLESIGAGSGRITSVTADARSSAGGATATASSANGKAVMVTIVLGGGDTTPPPAGLVTRWEMDEAAGATTMLAAGGNGPDGVIGADVRTGRSVLGATAYGFPTINPTAPPARPEHLVNVPDATRLDPDDARYTVTVRMRSQQNFGNMIQKGQATAAGGMWKFQMPNGVMQCLFRGENGTVRTASSIEPVNDGAWHVISCERSSSGVTMTVDGVVTDVRPGSTGPIANTWDLTIGGKGTCDQVKVTCDYFVGAIDWVQVTKG